MCDHMMSSKAAWTEMHERAIIHCHRMGDDGIYNIIT